ncbi:hypothetical protein NE237_017900 [Protea cynaroides]|uniref:AN1-type domain-containing protein n=1 Tax=Protea cynaroides TaxID=273540 RepID=A0A9Q0K904_9MAGN|nr:hypothetical protein NE237_017900 [Protea cynaroides]
MATAASAKGIALTITQRREVNRCSGTRRNVDLTGLRCLCGDLFFSNHRYSYRHVCSYDYKAGGREAIVRENPLELGRRVSIHLCCHRRLILVSFRMLRGRLSWQRNLEGEIGKGKGWLINGEGWKEKGMAVSGNATGGGVGSYKPPTVHELSPRTD